MTDPAKTTAVDDARHMPERWRMRYKLAKVQVSMLPPIEDDPQDKFKGVRSVWQEVVTFCEEISDLEAQLCREREKHAGLIVIASRYEDLADELQAAVDQLREMVEATCPAPEANCADCDAVAKHSYSDATTPGFFYDKCEKHRRADIRAAVANITPKLKETP